MAQYPALLAHEILQPENNGFFRRLADADLVAFLQRDLLRGIVRDHDGRSAHDFDADDGTCRNHQMIYRFGAVAECQPEPDPENAVGDAAVISRAAVNRGQPDAVADDLIGIQFVIDPDLIAQGADPFEIVDENIIYAGDAALAEFPGEFCQLCPDGFAGAEHFKLFLI